MDESTELNMKRQITIVSPTGASKNQHSYYSPISTPNTETTVDKKQWLDKNTKKYGLCFLKVHENTIGSRVCPAFGSNPECDIDFIKISIYDLIEHKVHSCLFEVWRSQTPNKIQVKLMEHFIKMLDKAHEDGNRESDLIFFVNSSTIHEGSPFFYGMKTKNSKFCRYNNDQEQLQVNIFLYCINFNN